MANDGTTTGSGGAHHALRDSLLQAVREEVIAYGVSRATLVSIARRAGVSRATVYRRVGGLPRLILDAFKVAYLDLNDRLLPDSTVTDGCQYTVELCAQWVTLMREDPFVTSVIRNDPELLLPYLVDQLGTVQLGLIAKLEAAISAGQEDGSIRAGDATRMGEVVLHSLTMFVIGQGSLAGLGGDDAIQAEVRRLVTGYLARK